MNGKVYIIGHKSPDLDSVASAIAYAYFKNHLESTDRYVAAIAGAVNRETEYALEKFNFDQPERLEDVSGRLLILVDHNEAQQSAIGIEQAKIAEIVDHHKVDFKYKEPIRIDIRPWGATSTIVADKFFDNKIGIEKDLAGLMLAAILVDTVISKSPTCAPADIKMMEKLAEIAKVADWKEFGMELFKIRSSVREMSAREIIMSDFKDFIFRQGKVGAGQVETADLPEFADKEAEILDELEKMKEQGGYHTVMLFITDIIKEGSRFLIASENMGLAEEALGAKIEGGKAYLDGIISRKKQVMPKFSAVYDE